MPHSSNDGRREVVLILIWTVVGAWVRFWSFGHLGLTHFDEGVYALTSLWVLSPHGLAAIEPALMSYSPPGFPILVGLAYAVFGVADVSAIFVSAICGVASIPIAAWVARRTFGPGAGASAAAFTALSMAHIAFSRKALTDVPFLLTWLVAIGLGGRFLERARLGRGLALGLAVGLAQNFKYNGWLAGIVIALSAVLGIVINREERHAGRVARTVGSGMLAALVAVALYLPWFVFVQRHGGYMALLRHHRSYLGGLSEWIPHWRQQMAQSTALSGGVAWAGGSLALALLSGVIATKWRTIPPLKSRSDWARGIAALVFGVVAFLLAPSFPWWFGLACVAWLLRDARPAPRLLGVSWLFLSILTPFYHPYARLWLPLQATCWLVLSGLTGHDNTVAASNLADSVPRSWPPRFGGLAVAAFGCVFFVGLVQERATSPRPLASFFRPTMELRDFVANLTSDRGADRIRGLRVLARRPISFYLLSQRQLGIQAESNLDQLLEPGRHDYWAIADEVELRQEGTLDRFTRQACMWPRSDFPWRIVRKCDEVLDPVTLLDVDADAPFGQRAEPSVSIWLLEPIPPVHPAP